MPDGRGGRWRFGLQVALALIVGVGLAGAGLAWWPTDHATPLDEGAPATGRPEDPEGFVAAWGASLEGTYRLHGTLVRRRGGDELALPVLVVQRPPDLLRVQGAAVEQRLDGTITRCDAAPGAPRSCTTGPVPEQEPAGASAAEVAALRALVTGPERRYRVVADGDRCWEAGLLGSDAIPALGITARFCFDDTTGAVVERRVDLGGVVEELRVAELRATVTDGDLALPDG